MSLESESPTPAPATSDVVAELEMLIDLNKAALPSMTGRDLLLATETLRKLLNDLRRTTEAIKAAEDAPLPENLEIVGKLGKAMSGEYAPDWEE